MTVGLFEAKTRFSELVELARQGQRITITRRGEPTAEIVPIERRRDLSPEDAAAALLEFRKGRSLDGISPVELRDAGRKR